MAATCLKCSNDENGNVEFASMAELIAHERAGHPLPPKDLPPSPMQKASKPAVAPVETPKPEKRAIVLVYKYEGVCEVCSGSLDTIPVDFNDHQLMIAYCPVCRKKYTITKVIPINQQFINNTPEKKQVKRPS